MLTGNGWQKEYDSVYIKFQRTQTNQKQISGHLAGGRDRREGSPRGIGNFLGDRHVHNLDCEDDLTGIWECQYVPNYTL